MLVRWAVAHWQVSFAVLAVGSVVLMLFMLKTSPTRRKRGLLNAALDEFDDLDPQIFVAEMARRLAPAGFTDVEIRTADEVDRDVPDVRAIDRLGPRVLLRCEQYVVENIGPKHVKALDHDAMDVYGADVAVLVTNRKVLPSAAILAEDLEMVTVDRTALGEWLVTGVMPYDVELTAFGGDERRIVALDADPYAHTYDEDVIDLRKQPTTSPWSSISTQKPDITRRRALGDRKRSPETA
ncbi:restriction endonuclease [Fodinicola feengrottensis]|uniref:restriction endonuclease n=1 Tax=Fodinicola feengrottensis TaxID=435914 RepID=UPI0013CFCFB3|nr:restriction endonuclease [Fodinicola feengrottensis]